MNDANDTTTNRNSESRSKIGDVPNLLNVKQVAAYLGVSVQRIRYEMHKRRIPYIKLGASVRFTKQKIDQWIEAREVEPKGYCKDE